MNNHIEATIDQVRASYPEAIESVVNFREEPTLIVAATHLLDVCNLLRFDSGLDYSLLVDIAFVDHYPNEPRFLGSRLRWQVSQRVGSLPNGQRERHLT